MSENTTDTDLVIPDELTVLKERADLLGIKYHPSISLEKLKAKLNSSDEEDEKADSPKDQEVESKEAFRLRKRQEANKLVRVQVTCMNPAKAEWDGELFTVGNSVVGSFTKFVPFNATDGYHIPHIIYEQLVERECQIFVTKTDSKGNKTRSGKLIKEFNVVVLPDLTLEEMQELAQRQAMAHSID